MIRNSSNDWLVTWGIVQSLCRFGAGTAVPAYRNLAFVPPPVESRLNGASRIKTSCHGSFPPSLPLSVRQAATSVKLPGTKHQKQQCLRNFPTKLVSGFFVSYCAIQKRFFFKLRCFASKFGVQHVSTSSRLADGISLKLTKYSICIPQPSLMCFNMININYQAALLLTYACHY